MYRKFGQRRRNHSAPDCAVELGPIFTLTDDDYTQIITVITGTAYAAVRLVRPT